MFKFSFLYLNIMNQFSISQLAQFSGIKPHTIRIWEQRYDALQPERSEGNTRYYNGLQLRRLLNIVSLRGAEYKVSDLAVLPDEKLFQLIKQEEKKRESPEMEVYFISQLIAEGMDYNEAGFEKIFSHCLLKYGLKEAYIKIIHPLLNRLGLLWSSDMIPPAHEHFISNILRQKFFTSVDALPTPKADSKKWVLFLPEDEFHEIGLLFAHYLIRFSQFNSFYLGANVPLVSLEEAVKDIQADNLLLFLVHNYLPENAQAYINELSAQFPAQKIYTAGSETLTSELKPPTNVRFLRAPDELERVIKQYV